MNEGVISQEWLAVSCGMMDCIGSNYLLLFNRR